LVVVVAIVVVAIVAVAIVVVMGDLRVDAIVARADAHVVDAGDFTDVVKMS